jgi:signal transduction histidine kinase
MFVGAVLTLIPGVIMNAILPIFGNDKAAFFGPNSLLFLALFTSIAIIKHRFLDIRLIVVRTLGYVLSLLTISSIAFIFLAYLSKILNENNISSSIQSSIYVALTLVLAASYQPFKRIFDSLTNKLFYRDAYDTQTLLNEFNETIVSTIDLEQLLERSSMVIEKYIKPDASAFAIRSKEDDTVRMISAENPKLSKEAIEQMRGYVHKSEEKVFVTDALEEGDERDLKLLLQEANVGMLVRITTDPAVEGTGYIILGYKKSGNVYNSQDTSAMEIMANELAIAIQNALQFEEIQQFTVTLQETVEEKTRQLRKSNEKLKQMDETKDEFISMASHQLRTPLTSVKGYVSMVIEGDAGELNPMQKKLLDQAFTSSQRMVYLIADLLNVSRLRTGKFVIDAIPSNLADVVKGEVDQLLETAASRDLELTYEKPDNFPELLLDETKIRQVIMNFIDNAIYYTPSGGHIRVELKDTGSTVEYTVTDDGLGVPKSEQHHLFTKFYRANNAKKARPDGTGLGLFMAKKVIVAQGGSLIFKSTEGKGSTFGFTFDKEKLKIPDHYVAPEELNGIKFGPNTSSAKDTK